MPSLLTSLSNLLTSIINTILAIFQNALNAIASLFSTILDFFGTILSIPLQALEGVSRFVLGNIVVLGGIALAIGGYVVYQNRRGGTVTVPGTGKKIN